MKKCRESEEGEEEGSRGREGTTNELEGRFLWNRDRGGSSQLRRGKRVQGDDGVRTSCLRASLFAGLSLSTVFKS